MAKGKSVCIYGAKGGIGKTTFALSLAGVLSNLNKKVLIIDLDLANGAIACSLNKNIKKTIYNFYDDYNNNRFESIESYVTNYNHNIEFISAPKDPRQSNKIDSKYIEILIDKCIYKYDIVLLDTSADLNEVNVLALDICDNILFITINDLIALKNLKNIINIIKDNEFSNYKIILNNSIYPDKNYFTNYDIKNILNANIDYVISKSFNYKKIDDTVTQGDILTLKYRNFKDYKIFELIAKDIIGGVK